MDVTLLAFVFGGLLLSVAVAGGSVRDLRVPKLGWTARRLSLLLGIAFISVALVLDLARSEPKAISSLPSASAVDESPGAALAKAADSRNLRDRHHQQRAVAKE